MKDFRKPVSCSTLIAELSASPVFAINRVISLGFGTELTRLPTVNTTPLVGEVLIIALHRRAARAPIDSNSIVWVRESYYHL